MRFRRKRFSRVRARGRFGRSSRRSRRRSRGFGRRRSVGRIRIGYRM